MTVHQLNPTSNWLFHYGRDGNDRIQLSYHRGCHFNAVVVDEAQIVPLTNPVQPPVLEMNVQSDNLNPQDKQKVFGEKDSNVNLNSHIAEQDKCVGPPNGPNSPLPQTAD